MKATGGSSRVRIPRLNLLTTARLSGRPTLGISMPRLLSALADRPPRRPRSWSAGPRRCCWAATPRPPLSDLDANTPGHVTGTITTSAPYVLVQLRRSEGSYLANPVYLTTTAGSADFDLDAWGYTGDDLQLTAVGCPRAEFVDCDPPVTFDQVFQVSDVQPTVTFPTDTTVGPGQDYDLTVSDPQGGGRLFAIWQNHEIPISRTGSTTLPPTAFVEGTGDLLIWRCTDHPPSPGFIYPCVATGISRSLAVDRTVSSSGSVSPSTIGPGTSSVTLNTTVSDAGTYVLDWQRPQRRELRGRLRAVARDRDRPPRRPRPSRSAGCRRCRRAATRSSPRCRVRPPPATTSSRP